MLFIIDLMIPHNGMNSINICSKAGLCGEDNLMDNVLIL